MKVINVSIRSNDLSVYIIIIYYQCLFISVSIVYVLIII